MKKLMLISSIVALGFFVGCNNNPSTNTVSNKEVKITGIRKSDLNAGSEHLPELKYNSQAPIPGKVKPQSAAFEGAPPMIPHSVNGMVPIKAGHNMCLNCHDRNNAKALGVTPMPKDHYVDNFEGNKQIHRIAGSRYFCTTCHAPQANIPVAVENKFESLKAKAGVQ